MGIEGNPVGKIVHHDLEKNGQINYYNIKIGNETYRYIPARMVEAVKMQEHGHTSKS